MAGCIKMPLGMEIGLSPGNFVLDGDPARYPERGRAPPNFRPTSILTKRLRGSRCILVRKITRLRRSRSFKFTDLGTNQKLIYDFLVPISD